MNKLIAIALCVIVAVTASAGQKKFFNLSKDDVKIDSILPQFVYSIPLDENYADSVYTIDILYPEFVDMSPADIEKYNRLSGAALPETPMVDKSFSFDRKNGKLVASFCPLVFRDNRYQIMVSFMLDIQSKALKKKQFRAASLSKVSADSTRYVRHSVLASGKWAKIRVPSDGVYQLTSALIKKAGFTDIKKVKIYGYGGHLQNEILNEDDLVAYDDLKEVPQCIVDGKHLFYGKGSVYWEDGSVQRVRNPYSDYGYYFLTSNDEETSTIDSASFIEDIYPQEAYYHSLYENDGYSWLSGGRNLFDSEALSAGTTKTWIVKKPADATSGELFVRATAGTASKFKVSVNSTTYANLSISIPNAYYKGNWASGTWTINNLSGNDTIKVTVTSGGPVHLDYMTVRWNTPYSLGLLADAAQTPEYVYNITNQDHHADTQADMVIIIPTSQKLLEQAQILKEYHESRDSLKVNIVPADELYNEFSSGTPDANAYRRYLKMLYDRAATDSELPKYLLLFGDCVWDNRMLTSDCNSFSVDDYLLCFESENSLNDIYSFVDDSWFGLLDDGEGGSPTTEQIDVAVGRFPVTSASEAQVMVNKTINYGKNQNAGDWENIVVFLGDDGNDDMHMKAQDEVAEYIKALYPSYLYKKVMWDAYTREVSSTGATYPEVTRLIKRQQANGALIFDYAGHGSGSQLSHETVLTISDFENFTNTNLPLWITASCEVMPFDAAETTLGEAAVLNANGGAVAFYGTTRTVYAHLNKYMNRAYLRRVLSKDSNGNPITLGEAHRLAQNDLITGAYGETDRSENRLQYSLLGDPALAINQPSMQLVIDSINGEDVKSNFGNICLSAGTIASVKGHVEGAADFNGVVTATVMDSKELIVCRANDMTEKPNTDDPFQYYDRTKILFNGSDSIIGSEFKFVFAVPLDINYSDESGLINLFAYNNEKTLTANGYNEDFIVGGSDIEDKDSLGPSIYCYLNTPSFCNGGSVNNTPFFVAEVSDDDGINATGNGIGHDLELIIDGKMDKTYVLNDNFSFDFGSYTKGITWYSIPELEPGTHKLLFRAWDVLNNSSTAELTFNVVSGLKPNLVNVYATPNPASSSTTFVITHDRAGSEMDVKLEVFDFSGRLLWSQSQTDVTSASNYYTMTWDLCLDGGGKLSTGVYLYRVSISADGSEMSTKAKKLVVY